MKNIGQQILSRFLLIAIVLISLIFYTIQPKFLNINNVMDILRTSSIVGIMALGGMYAMAIGEINFAVGGQAMVTACIVGKLMDGVIGNYFIAILVAVIFIILSGFLVSYVVVDLKVPSFIATLALNQLTRGFARLFSGGQPFTSDKWPEIYRFIGQKSVFGIIPNPVVLFLLLAVISLIVTERTRFGRYIFASGTNSTACIQVGIDVRKVKYASFIISSILAAFAGIVHTSVTATVTLTMADDYLTPSLCAIVLGATYYKIGFYNVRGTILSSIMLILIQNGVMSIGAQYYVKDIIQGVILLVSVGIIAMTRKEGLPKVSFENS